MSDIPVINYLDSIGKDSSYTARKNLYQSFYPGSIFTGSEVQNNQLLAKLQNDAKYNMPSDVINQMFQYNPLNLVTTSQQAVKPIPKAVINNMNQIEIENYLKSIGRPYDFTARKNLYQGLFPSEIFYGSEAQNLKLLEKLKADALVQSQDILTQMNQYNPLNLMATPIQEIKPVPVAVAKYVEQNYVKPEEEMQYESTQTEEQKKAYLSQDLVKIPAFTGTIIEKLNKVLAYYDTQVKTTAFQSSSQADKEKVFDIFIEASSKLLENYYKQNQDEINGLPGKLLNAGKVSSVNRAKELQKQMQSFLAARSGGMVSGLGVISNITKAIVLLVLGKVIGDFFDINVFEKVIKKKTEIIIEFEKLKNQLNAAETKLSQNAVESIREVGRYIDRY